MAEPNFKSHLSSEGRYEKVDVSKYCHKVLCSVPGCFQIRYVLPQDATRVKLCKPHAAEERKRYRAEFMKKARKERQAAKLNQNEAGK